MVGDFKFLNTSHLFANWTQPSMPNGNLRYDVNLTSTDLFRGTMTLVLSQEIVDLSVLLAVPMLFYTEYNITVLPFTGAGIGEGVSGSFETQQEGASASSLPDKSLHDSLEEV